MTPALEAVVMFADRPPPAAALPRMHPPRFTADLVNAPFPGIAALLADPDHPLSDRERGAAASARTALVLRSGDPATAIERLDACLARIELFRTLGAVAVVLPAARRVLGPSFLAALPGDAVERRVAAFIHGRVEVEGAAARIQTLGLAQLGRPELACRVGLADVPRAVQILDEAVRAFASGAGPWRDRTEVERVCEGTVIDRFSVRARGAALLEIELSRGEALQPRRPDD